MNQCIFNIKLMSLNRERQRKILRFVPSMEINNFFSFTQMSSLVLMFTVSSFFSLSRERQSDSYPDGPFSSLFDLLFFLSHQSRFCLFSNCSSSSFVALWNRAESGRKWSDVRILIRLRLYPNIIMRSLIGKYLKTGHRIHTMTI